LLTRPDEQLEREGCRYPELREIQGLRSCVTNTLANLVQLLNGQSIGDHTEAIMRAKELVRVVLNVLLPPFESALNRAHER
jgi:hypothetical protein